MRDFSYFCERTFKESDPTSVWDSQLVIYMFAFENSGHQRAIMGNMTVEEIYQDRKTFAKNVFEVASLDLINMGITVVSYTLKDVTDSEG